MLSAHTRPRPPSEPSEAAVDEPAGELGDIVQIAFAVGSGCRYGFLTACPEPAAERAERSEASEAAVDEPADELGDILQVAFAIGCGGSMPVCVFLFRASLVYGRPSMEEKNATRPTPCLSHASYTQT